MLTRALWHGGYRFADHTAPLRPKIVAARCIHVSLPADHDSQVSAVWLRSFSSNFLLVACAEEFDAKSSMQNSSSVLVVRPPLGQHRGHSVDRLQAAARPQQRLHQRRLVTRRVAIRLELDKTVTFL